MAIGQVEGQIGGPIEVGGQPPGVVQVTLDDVSTPAPDVSDSDAVFAGDGAGQFLLSLRHRARSNRYPVSRR